MCSCYFSQKIIRFAAQLFGRSEYVKIFSPFYSSDAADYYMEKEGLFVLHEDQKVHLAINRLGLTTLSPFNAK